ncbi:MAG: sigma-54-dependent Fis family transcriptional regulator [Candidatus Auribacter fodinae]|jgi:DNA-binding NtrC family response regulator|uniref:Sigma-54-dependent Fis family transcriptional regulator n=1 Tax=Candidatus Auribacter fodinae TaxID=2093366 RepID=A0A3A4R3L1_9BACT|nr:MAG: sigma-54-dependent Fis family transcriptional regulator [Candidatus Auribacter fodinae]
MKKHILLVDDDPSTLEMFQIMLEAQDYSVAHAYDGISALEKIRKQDFDLVITDLKMPGKNGIELLHDIKMHFPEVEVIMTTAYMTVDTAISAMKIGAYDYITKPISDIERSRMIIEKALEKSHIQKENRSLRSRLYDVSVSFSGVIGSSKPMRTVFDIIKKVADTDTTVLIEGESGTGKELVAVAIHNMSSRKNNKLVPVDCGSLPRELLESELFGHTRGSFTGAVMEKRGLFEEAHGGTLFLDEISSTDQVFQSKLLRALQTREIKRVGGNNRIQIDTRLIVASNKNLMEEVRNERFRKDLFYRINIVPIHLPSLRDRKEDIPLLCEHFLHKFSIRTEKQVKKVSDEAMHLFMQYSWPGNIRELENVIERAVIMTASDRIERNDLPIELFDSTAVDTRFNTGQLRFNEARSLFEKTYLTNLLRTYNGNITAAAEKAGLLRQGLQSKIKKYGISPSSFK